MKQKAMIFFGLLILLMLACQSVSPSLAVPTQTQNLPAQPPTGLSVDNGFDNKPALPNNSGIDGVQTFPDKPEYHDHVNAVNDPGHDLPPAFGAHLSAWQNCGIYNKPVDLGLALHSMEHGAVWLTYAPDLSTDDISALQDIVRGLNHGYVLMSPYLTQKKPVVLTAWTVQLVIDSLPDDRIAKFISYYQQGPQNPEPGAPCNGAVGNPLP